MYQYLNLILYFMSDQVVVASNDDVRVTLNMSATTI